MKKFDLIDCYKLAWKSFSKWWIPLTLISFFVVFFQILPQILSMGELSSFKKDTIEIFVAIFNSDADKLETLSASIVDKSQSISVNFMKMGTILFPLTALLSIVLIMQANLAVKDTNKRERTFFELIYISVVHVVLAIVKLFAFFLFVIPGVFLYIKLLFVSLVMLEEKEGVWTAIKKSWQLTEGNFWPLLTLVVLNTSVQGMVVPTIIGAIPATAFVNTARASAYRQLLLASQEQTKEVLS